MFKSNYVRVNFMLPRDVYSALKSLIPERKRSQIVTNLLQSEIRKREQELFKIAKSVEKDSALNAEMKDWNTTIHDGLGETEWK
ncbi:MAG: hypothetical protein HYT97_06705 [Elusimicrobia bacterium]|nr:hypothetical protein [Elusimicrobiota bacterium]